MADKQPECLVCMRLVDMARHHPAQDNSHVCLRCHERLGMYPSGQKALKKWPNITLLCSRCAANIEREVPAIAMPYGTVEEILQEVRDSKPAGKA